MDIKKIKQMIKVFEESSLAKLDVEDDAFKIRMEKPESKGSYQTAPIMATTTNPFKGEKEVEKNDKKDWIKSPLVGTFYAAPSPDVAPFVKVGDYIKEGDVLCIIEAMKVMNEVKAPRSGYITEIKAQNGELVGFDDDLMALGEKE